MKRVVTEKAFLRNTMRTRNELPGWFYEVVGKTREEIKKVCNWSVRDEWFEDVEEESKGEY